MRRMLAAACLAVAGLVVSPAGWAEAGTDRLLVELLIRKGIISHEEYEKLRQEIEATTVAPVPTPAIGAAAPAVPGPTAEELVDRLRDEVREELRRKDAEALSVAATLSGEARFRLYKDAADSHSGSSSELYLRSAQVDLEARPLSWLTLNLAVKSEYVGADTTNEGQEADPTPFIDTGTLTLQGDGRVPLYGVVGKRTQPYGGFLGDDRFNTDPISKNAYEVNQVGATIGYAPDWLGLDVSLTVYRQEQHMEQLFASGLFDSKAVVRQATAGLAEPSDSLAALIGAVTLEPRPDLRVGAAYVSEPGAGRRNQTLGLWGSYAWRGTLIWEAEVHAALARERYVRQVTTDGVTTPVVLGRAFRETVVALGLTWKPLGALDVGGRVELYGDDGLADAAETWSTRYRVLAGVGYTLYERGDVAVRLIGEYRFTEFRRGGAASRTAAPDQHELFGKLAVTYR